VPTILNQLRGFRFLRSEGGTFLSESWRVLTPAGRERILHRFFGLSPKRAVEGLAKLHALVHPGLLPMQLLGSDGEQLLMLGETFDHSLLDRFAGYWDRGTPGIPVLELLDCLRATAETLDALDQAYSLHHLALRPRSVVFKDGQPLLKGFGILQLLWAPNRWLPARVNTRYAAPELFEGRTTPRSDQYSLALVYAEMRCGVHPFARHSPPAPVEPDLDLVSSAEQEVLRRALSLRAYARYPNCVTFIKELERASSVG
jgi:hypothetical protein